MVAPCLREMRYITSAQRLRYPQGGRGGWSPRLEVKSTRSVYIMASAARIASIFAIVLCGWQLHRYLPKELCVHFRMAVSPLNRVAFWACLITASLVTTVWVIRLCLQDLRIR